MTQSDPTRDLRERIIREITVAPGWNKADATALVDDLIASATERLARALRVNTHKPHDQAGEPDSESGFPVCSVCGAIQTVLAALSTPPPSDLTFPHRGSWRHAGWCEFERGSETVCSCGLDDARRTLIGAPHDPE